jgi:hypothetical protein
MFMVMYPERTDSSTRPTPIPMTFSVLFSHFINPNPSVPSESDSKEPISIMPVRPGDKTPSGQESGSAILKKRGGAVLL